MRGWLLLAVVGALFAAMWLAGKVVGPDDPDGDDQW